MAHKFTRLTRDAIRALKAGGRIAEHGITAERLASGAMRYSVNVMVDGQRIHRVIGRDSDGTTRKQAEDAIATLKTRAREGRLDLPTGRKAHQTFEDAAMAYLAKIEHHPKHGKNLARKRQHIEQRLSPYFKKQRPDKITDFSIAHYGKRRSEEGASKATVNRELSTLSHFLNRALEWGWIKTKPRIDKSAEPRKQITVLADNEKAALMTAALEDQDPLTWLFVAIALGTGMRHSEVLRVRWDEIEFDLRRIYIGRAKAGQREQPIPSNLANKLEEEWEAQGRPEGYLFPNARADAKAAHRSTMAMQFRRAVVSAGLNPAKVTPHILRHTAITELVRAGVDLPTIQRISGHKTLAMVLRYTQLSDSHIDQSLAKLNEAFAGAFTPELHTGKNVHQISNSNKG